MRQKTRYVMLLLSLLMFPITMNYLSPYVSIDGAMIGVVSGSLIVFALLFLSGIFLGRAWCAWLCPMGGLSELCLKSNAKNVNIKKLKIIRYVIYGIWSLVLVSMFILAGGIRSFNPFHLTETGISVDEPMKYIWYYLVVFLFLLLSLLLGKRGACQSLCWMAPFLTAGYHLGKWLKMPQLRILSKQGACIGCGACERKCSMSLPVGILQKNGVIRTSDCILCGECVDACGRKALSYGFTH